MRWKKLVLSVTYCGGVRLTRGLTFCLPEFTTEPAATIPRVSPRRSALLLLR